MNRTTPNLRNFARRLVACESKGNTSPGAKAAAAFLVIEKLRPQLTILMGNAGFRALLSRSLALASAEIPGLRTVSVRADGALEGVDKLTSPKQRAEAGVALVAQVLGLLAAFIGEKLTLQMMGEIWPKLSCDKPNFDEGDKE